MVDILIQPPELRRISEQLRTSAQKIEAAMQAIDDAISSLKGDKFLGNRSDKVRANYAPQREALLTAKNVVLHFEDELKNTANIFEQADRSDGRKKIIYLINGINYDGNESSLKKLQERIKEQYGDNVDVRIVGDHPYDSNLQQYNINIDGTKYGRLLSQIDWRIGASVWLYNKGLGVANTVYGVGQVATEYITGGSSQSRKVYDWIDDNLRKDGLIKNTDVDIVLVGHSGGGAIAPNIVAAIEKKLGVNVSGIVTMGSPLSNYDHGSKYGKIFDVEHEGDGIGRIANIGPIRSDENRYLVPSLIGGDKLWQDASGNIHSVSSTTGTDNPNNWGDAHGSYWNSSEVVDAIGAAL